MTIKCLVTSGIKKCNQCFQVIKFKPGNVRLMGRSYHQVFVCDCGTEWLKPGEVRVMPRAADHSWEFARVL